MKFPKITKIRILILIILGQFLFVIYLFNIFSLSSNLELLLEQSGTVNIKTNEGWLSCNKITNDKYFKKITPILYKSNSVIIRKINIKRSNYSFFRKLKNIIIPNRVYIFEFNKKCSFSVVAKVDKNFEFMTAGDSMKYKNLNFTVNGSFYDKSYKHLGAVVIDGKKFGKINKKQKGFFKVINKIPYAGAKNSLFAKIKGKPRYACQAHPTVIGRGYIWGYLKKKNNLLNKWWSKKTYRNLIGMTKNGNIVFIVSGSGGLLTIYEIAKIAKLYGLIHATMFDGGMALQYHFKERAFELSFCPLNNVLTMGNGFNNWFENTFRMPFYQTSPVYIGVKTKTQLD